MNPWKVLGLAGLAGVAAAGVIVAREQRQRTVLAPEDIRARLHERLEQAAAEAERGTVPGIPVSAPKHRRKLPRPQRRWLPRPRRRATGGSVGAG